MNTGTHKSSRHPPAYPEADTAGTEDTEKLGRLKEPVLWRAPRKPKGSAIVPGAPRHHNHRMKLSRDPRWILDLNTLYHLKNVRDHGIQLWYGSELVAVFAKLRLFRDRVRCDF